MEQFKDEDRLLVADIGGTNARFAFADKSVGADSLTPPICSGNHFLRNVC